MSFLIGQLKIFVVDKVIKFIFTKVKQKIASRNLQMLFLILILFVYYHVYFYVIVAGIPTLYEQIGASPRSNPAEIKSILRKLYRQHHPDKGGQSSASFLHYQKIGSVLDDSNQKWMYDRFNLDPELTAKYRLFN